MSYLEPWLREIPMTLDPLLHGLLCSFIMAEEEVAQATADLSDEQVWANPQGLTSIGFHLQHLCGSLDRLLTYVQSRELSPEQLESLQSEVTEEASLAVLRERLQASLCDGKAVLEQLDASQFSEFRHVGRKRIPVALGALLLHIAEHTQRHVGQVVTTAKLFHAG